MKAKLLFIAALMAVINCLPAWAATKDRPTISYVGCTPASGSVVSDFNFEIEFDLSNVYAKFGYDPDLGIMIGSNSTLGFKLYKGKDATGDLVHTLFNYSVTGEHEEFQTGNKIAFEYDKDLFIDGETYTISIEALFTVRKKGNIANPMDGASGWSQTLSCDDNPILVTFTAKVEGGTSFALKEWSVPDGDIEEFNDITLTFTKPVTLADGAKAALYYAQDRNETWDKLLEEAPITLSESDPNTAVVNFSGITAFSGWQYKLLIEEGSFAEKENPDNKYMRIRKYFSGAAVKHYRPVSIEPVFDEHGVPCAVKVVWDSDEPMQTGVKLSIEDGPGWTLSIEDETGAGSAFITATGWPETTYTLNNALWPSMKYRFKLEEAETYGLIPLSDSDWTTRCLGLTNEAFDFEFTTPAIETVSGLPSYAYNYVGVFKTGSLNELTKIDSGYETDYIGTVEAETLDFTYGGKTFEVTWDYKTKGLFYEVTDEGDVLIKECPTSAQRRGSNGLYLKNTVAVAINETLKKGHVYKLVIPENALESNSRTDLMASHYITTPKLEFLFNGTTIYNLKYWGNAIADDAEVEELGVAVWNFNKKIVVTDAATCDYIYEENGVEKKIHASQVYKVDGTNYGLVKADFTAENGLPLTVTEPRAGRLVLRAASVRHEMEEDLLNEEETVSFTLVPRKQQSVEEPVFRSCTLYLNDETGVTTHKVNHEVINGRETTVTVGHGDWQVASLKVNGADKTSEVSADGKYTFTPAGDLRLDAQLTYAGQWMVEHSSGVYGIADSPLKVYTQNGQAIIEGLQPGEEVTVYSAAGQLVKAVKAEQDKMRLTLSGGVYIVIVNGQAAKVIL